MITDRIPRNVIVAVGNAPFNSVHGRFDKVLLAGSKIEYQPEKDPSVITFNSLGETFVNFMMQNVCHDAKITWIGDILHNYKDIISLKLKLPDSKMKVIVKDEDANLFALTQNSIGIEYSTI